MSWIKSLTTVLLSTFIALIIAEIILRVIGLGYGNAPLIRSSVYHHVHPSNYEFFMHDPYNNEYGGFNVYYDDLGFRVNNKASKTIKLSTEKNSIIFLGDSFTEGNQVPYDQTFVALVGLKQHVSFINMGVSGYSPLINKLLVENILPKFKGKTVILQAFSNDPREDDLLLDKAIFENDRLTKIDGGKDNIFINFARKSYFLRLLRKSQLLLKAISANQITNADSRASIFEVEQKMTNRQLKNTVKTIHEINKILI